MILGSSRQCRGISPLKIFNPTPPTKSLLPREAAHAQGLGRAHLWNGSLSTPSTDGAHSLTHAHTQTHTQTRRHTHTRTQTHTDTQADTDRQAGANTDPQPLRPHTYAETHSRQNFPKSEEKCGFSG